eukprot:11405354-Prorocentrum_lima.AAC.1
MWSSLAGWAIASASSQRRGSNLALAVCAAEQAVNTCSDPASPMEQSGQESAATDVSKCCWADTSPRRPATSFQH